MKNNLKTWNEYYNKKSSITNIFLHYFYILKILSYFPKNILEIGCGPANHSYFFKKFFPKLKISVLDLDKNLLEKIKIEHINLFNNFYNINVLDEKKIKNLPIFDIIISQGLMEHFNDKEFINIINNFSKISSKMIFSIPSDNYPSKDFGDEILRSKKEIEKILFNHCSFKYKVYAYPFDIGLRTKLILINNNKMDFIENFLVLISSCHLLIEIDYKNKNPNFNKIKFIDK